MPTFKTNPFSQQDPRIAQGMSVLAEALVPNPDRALQRDMTVAEFNAGLQNTYSNTYANEALAGQRNALAGRYGAETDLLTDTRGYRTEIDKIWADPDTDYDTKLRLSTPYVAMLELDPESLIATAPAFGVDMAGLDPYRRALGDAFGTTREAFDRELIEGMGPGGNPMFMPRSTVEAGGPLAFSPMVSETDAKGYAFSQLTPGQQEAAVLGDVGPEVITAWDPENRQMVSTTPAEALANGWLPTDTPKMGDFTTPEGGGLGLADKTETERMMRLVSEYNRMVSSGEPTGPDLDRQYALAYNSLFGPRNTIQTDPVTQKRQLVTIYPNIPGGLVVPPGMAGVAAAPGTPGVGAPTAQGTAQAPTPLTADGNVTVQDITEGRSGKSLTETQIRLTTLAGDFGNGVRDLAKLVDYNPETDTFGPDGWWPTAGYEFSKWVQGLPLPLAGYAANTGRSDQSNEFVSIEFNVIEPLLRLRTGAAAPETEQVGYRLGLLPQAGMSPEVNQARVRRLFRQLAAYENVANQMGLTLPQLDAIMLANPEDPRYIEARARAEVLIREDETARDENPAFTQASGAAAPETPGNLEPRKPVTVQMLDGTPITGYYSE